MFRKNNKAKLKYPELIEDLSREINKFETNKTKKVDGKFITFIAWC